MLEKHLCRNFSGSVSLTKTLGTRPHRRIIGVFHTSILDPAQQSSYSSFLSKEAHAQCPEHRQALLSSSFPHPQLSQLGGCLAKSPSKSCPRCAHKDHVTSTFDICEDTVDVSREACFRKPLKMQKTSGKRSPTWDGLVGSLPSSSHLSPQSRR